jgi:hydrogenase expression/formation protein HypD
MKYLDEYRDGPIAAKIVAEIRHILTQPWVLMEVCGGQTHSIVKHGIDHLLPEGIELVHGPGCPVCVTPLEMIDKAHSIAQRPDVIFCSFGDMLRVPGSDGDLFTIKSRGGDVRIVYSPLDCLKIARSNPGKQVVFFAIGFETTAPANAMLVSRAQKEGVKNVSILVSHVLVPPSIASILQSPLNRVQGFLGPGHVCAVMGYREYEPLSARFRVPIVITGFEPLDILQGTLMTVRQLETGRAVVENQYSRILDRDGNLPAQKLVASVFEIADRKWRGIGTIPKSGYKLRWEFREHDAERLFDVKEIDTREPEACISGQILRGIKKPHDCAAFGTICTPQRPLGATMVSAEGACAAYYAYGRHLEQHKTEQQKEAQPTEAQHREAQNREATQYVTAESIVGAV